MKNILILCTGNSCRSQIAHGYFAHFTDQRSVKIYSACVETHGVNPRAVATMLEDKIDISGNTSNLFSEYEHIKFDLVLTVCDHAHERCPYFPNAVEQVHFNFPDPAKAIGTEEEIMMQFAQVRQQIKVFVQNLVTEKGF